MKNFPELSTNQDWGMNYADCHEDVVVLLACLHYLPLCAKIIVI